MSYYHVNFYLSKSSSLYKKKKVMGIAILDLSIRFYSLKTVIKDLHHYRQKPY